MKMSEELICIINRGYQSHRRNSKLYGLAPISKEDFYKLFEDALARDFKCYYCGCELILDRLGDDRIPSVDHKISLDSGGINSLGNMVICCYRCNKLKSMISEETLVRFSLEMYTDIRCGS